MINGALNIIRNAWSHSQRGVLTFIRALVAVVVTGFATALSAENIIPDYYSEPGLMPGRTHLNQTPYEHIDPFSGILHLQFTDLVIPGNGGMDLKMIRSYTSRGYTPENIFGFRHVNGVGWTLHFGRVVQGNDTICTNRVDNILDNPVLELPDGSRHIFYNHKTVNSTGPLFLSSERWKAECFPTSDGRNGLLVTSPEGIVYTMSHFRQTFAWSSNEFSWYATKITDPNNNQINISYRNSLNTYALIDSVTTSDGRQLVFGYTDEGTFNVRLTSITARHGPTSAAWVTLRYEYTKIAGVNGDYWHLTRAVRPDGTAWVYAYHPVPTTNPPEPGAFSLRQVIHPSGGSTNYTYKYVEFDNNFNNLLNISVDQKTTAGPSVAPGTWNFSYAPGSGLGALDVTTITAPDGTYVFRHFGYRAATSGTVWKIGRLIEKEFPGLHLERYDWGTQLISNEAQFRRVSDSTSVKDDTSVVPILLKRTIVRDGTSYITQYSNHDTFGNPRTITETGNATKTTNLTYLSNQVLRWFLRKVTNESIVGFGSVSRSYDANGNMTSKNEFGVTTTYAYHATGDVSQIADARGVATSYSNYKRGVAQTETHPEGVTVSRVVNDTGTIQRETNGRQFTRTFTYDGLNRITAVTFPINLGKTVVWSPTTKVTTRGSFKETVSFDGFRRPIQVEKQDLTKPGSSIVVTFRYDAVGRKIFDSYPNSAVGTSFEYDTLGRLKAVIHADGARRTYAYSSGNRVTVQNERLFSTAYTYRSFGDPDERNLMRTDASEGVSTVFVRNILGQIVNVTQGTVERTYAYNTSNFLVSEANPETGTTTYGRDAIGNMTSKQVGASGITVFTYDGLNRLRNVNYPGTTPDVSLQYDGNDNLIQVANSGVATWTYGYDANDNLTTETLSIDGQALTVRNSYNGLDFLTSITYPSARVISYNPDALGRSTTVSPYLTGVTYHPNGVPSTLNYANGRQTTTTLNNRQLIANLSTPGLVDLQYAYDGRGNVISIADAIRPQTNRTLGYDGIDRLITANGVWGAGTIGYDDTGNIQSMALGGATTSYAYASHRLASVSGARNANFTYDVYGNVTGNERHSFLYDDAGNLRAVSGASSAAYLYDGNDRRVRVQKGSTFTYNLYSKNGNLLGEYDGTGFWLKEYAYLGGKLVGMVFPNPNNIAPTANAGANQTVDEQVLVTLNGSGSTDPDGTIFSYSWVQTDGPAVALTNATSVAPTFTSSVVLSDTPLSFALTVRDNDGASASASVTITVRDSNPDNDADGLPDAWELRYFGNLNQGAGGDPDGDGLTNLQEFQFRADPTKSDTDGDGVSDGQEVANGTDPTVNIPAIMTIIQELLLSD
jgi:YD repeat-containing protein